MKSVDESVQLENFVAGRSTLGAIFHTLQVRFHVSGSCVQV